MRARGSVDSPSNATPAGPRRLRPRARPRLLHRVEEDAVHAELAHELGRSPPVVHVLAPRAGVPRVVVHEHAKPRAWSVLHELPEPWHVAVVVELVPIVDPDHRIGMPEHNAVESAELPLRLVESRSGVNRPRHGRTGARPRARPARPRSTLVSTRTREGRTRAVVATRAAASVSPAFSVSPGGPRGGSSGAAKISVERVERHARLEGDLGR